MTRPPFSRFSRKFSENSSILESGGFPKLSNYEIATVLPFPCIIDCQKYLTEISRCITLIHSYNDHVNNLEESYFHCPQGRWTRRMRQANVGGRRSHFWGWHPNPALTWRMISRKIYLRSHLKSIYILIFHFTQSICQDKTKTTLLFFRFEFFLKYHVFAVL